jgi:hypothetical protein
MALTTVRRQLQRRDAGLIERGRVLGNIRLRVLVAWVCRVSAAMQLMEHVGENVIVTQTRVRIPFASVGLVVQ